MAPQSYWNRCAAKARPATPAVRVLPLAAANRIAHASTPSRWDIMTVRLVLFGSPALHVDGESIALPFERRNQLLAFLALKRVVGGTRRTGGDAVAGAGDQARVHEPAQDALPPPVVRVGGGDRSAGELAALRGGHRRAGVRAGAAGEPGARGAGAAPRTRCSRASTTTAARHGPAGWRSSATACASRGAVRRSTAWPARSTRPKGSTCPRGCSTTIRSTRRRCACTWHGWSAAARRRVPARRIATSSSASPRISG